MSSLTVEDRNIGVNFLQGGTARVVVWAPEASQVSIKLTETNESILLIRKEYGYWELVTERIKEGTLYKFVLDDKTELPDPASLSQPQGVHGSSAAINVTQYAWTDQSWNNLPLEDYLLYELHTGTFTPEGTFQGIIDKLDYLKELGINAIEVMPVAQFPGNRNWGYDGVFIYAVQNTYGGAVALQQLVNACHLKGMAVVLDVVYNHVGPEGNYLGQYGPYFTSKYNTPWGPAINFDDAYCDPVREYYIQNVLMWFRDFHIDALRMDAVHAIKDFSPKHILQEIKEKVDELKERTGQQHYLIIEFDLNDTRFINSLESNGYGMQSQWIDEFHHALRVAGGEQKSGYYADFNGLQHLAKSYRDAYVYDGQYSPHRHKKFGVKAESNPGKQFVVFSQNHDHVGNRMLGERTSGLVSFEMLKLMAGAVACAPYLPMLFMGEEYAETHPFLYFVSHTDTQLVEAVRKGRKEEFKSFHTEGEAPDPQSEVTFEQSKLQWGLLVKPPHSTMLDYYKKLYKLRKRLSPLRYPDRKNIEVKVQEAQQLLILHRWYKEEHILCMMNFSKQVQSTSVSAIALPLQKVLDSADPLWGGHGGSADRINGESEISIQPESFIIYSGHV